MSLNNVRRKFGGLDAVCDIHMDIAHGERRALLGSNGAGKTTLFNLIAGDLPVTGGRILLFGKDVTKMSIRKRVEMGLRRTYQASAVFPSLTVFENLYLGVLGPNRRGHLNIFRVAKKDRAIKDRIDELTDMIGLADVLNLNASNLSHGEARQLEIGLALGVMSKFIMLDEPAAGLSPAERSRIMKMLKALDPETTLLIIEHDMDLALGIADKVTILNEGRIVAEGSPKEITANAMVQEIYLGSETSR